MILVSVALASMVAYFAGKTSLSLLCAVILSLLARIMASYQSGRVICSPFIISLSQICHAQYLRDVGS